MNGMLHKCLAEPVLLAVFPRLDGALSMDRVFFQLRREAFSQPDFHCKGKRKQISTQDGQKMTIRYAFDFGGKNFVEWEKRTGGRILERAFCEPDQSYCVKTYQAGAFVSKIDYYTSSHQWSRTEFFRSPGEKELDAVITRDFLTDQITLRRQGEETLLARIPGLDFQSRPLLYHVQRHAGLPEAVLFSQTAAAGYCREQELDLFLKSIASFTKDGLSGLPTGAPPGPVKDKAKKEDARQAKEKPRHAAPSPPTAVVLHRARAALQKAREEDDHV